MTLKNETIFKRNLTVRIAICIGLLIPIVVAVILFSTTDKTKISQKNVISVSIDEHLLTDESSIALFSSIQENSKKIDAENWEFPEETPYTLSFKENDGVALTYTLYMSADTKNCLYKNKDGEYFIIDTDLAEKLLLRNEFSALNKLQNLPLATVTGLGEKTLLSPVSYDWSYVGFDGKMTNGKSSSTGSEVPTVYCNGTTALDILFENEQFNEPDEFTVTVTKGEGTTAIYTGSVENMADAVTMDYSKDTVLKLSAEAKWLPADGVEYYGTVVYKAKLFYDIAPEYYSVDYNKSKKGGVTDGDFTVVRLKNFNDGDTLKMVNGLGIHEDITVYDYVPYDGEYDGDYDKLIFIPCTVGTAPEVYKLEFTTGNGLTGEAEVKVKSSGKTYKSSDFIVSDDQALAESYSADAVKEYNELIDTLSKQSVNSRLYDKKFVYPTGSDSAGNSYGNTRVITTANNVIKEKYINQGIDLAASEGQSIKASNNGVVVYADKTTLLGNTVIVDHGQGILSVYGNLDSFSVSVGSEVEIGKTEIGIAGSTGFACVSGTGGKATRKTLCHFAISFNGKFIDPASPVKYGVNMGNI